MSLLTHGAPTVCPSCHHPRPGVLGRLLEPLVWTEPSCHTLVHDPWSYPGDDECGCRADLHQHRWLSRSR